MADVREGCTPHAELIRSFRGLLDTPLDKAGIKFNVGHPVVGYDVPMNPGSRCLRACIDSTKQRARVH